MKSSLQKKLIHMAERFEEVNLMLSDPDIIQQNERFRELSKEYAQLQPLATQYRLYDEAVAQLAETEILLNDTDSSVRELAKEEWQLLQSKMENLQNQLQILLLPQDPKDSADIFLEIRAAAGGDESAIFAGDLFRMYAKYAEKKQWQMEILQSSDGEHGGYKIIVARISGQQVYAHLKFESGAHRVQRVPETEAQGRVHTSTCTVAILPESEQVEEIDINPAELKIDTFRASGAGGQHVNKTDSAIRITHLPTGTVVECQDERSQHKNRARAMSLLKAKLLDSERTKQEQQQRDQRRSLVGTGDRSERIRTYNFPQGRLTDHRINLTVYKLNDIVEGELDVIINPLRHEYQAELLSTLGEE